MLPGSILIHPALGSFSVEEHLISFVEGSVATTGAMNGIL